LRTPFLMEGAGGKPFLVPHVAPVGHSLLFAIGAWPPPDGVRRTRCLNLSRDLEVSLPAGSGLSTRSPRRSVCDPSRLPLPVLVRAASRPSAGLHLPDTLRREIVRLGGQALCPQQARWPYRPQTGEMVFRPDLWGNNHNTELLWLEDELSGHLLSLYERHRPGMLEGWALELIWSAKKAI
jgi:hypothetical protein